LINSVKGTSNTGKPVIPIADFNTAKIISDKFDDLSPNQSIYLGTTVQFKEARYSVQLQTRNNVYHEKIVFIEHDNSIVDYGYQLFTRKGKLIEQWYSNTTKLVKDQMIKKLNTIDIMFSYT